jgi:hypothetical protein
MINGPELPDACFGVQTYGFRNSSLSRSSPYEMLHHFRNLNHTGKVTSGVGPVHEKRPAASITRQADTVSAELQKSQPTLDNT